MPVLYLNPLRDAQQAPVTGYCARCGGERYGDWSDSQICTDCRAELADVERKAVEEAEDRFPGKGQQWQ